MEYEIKRRCYDGEGEDNRWDSWQFHNKFEAKNDLHAMFNSFYWYIEPSVDTVDEIFDALYEIGDINYEEKNSASIEEILEIITNIVKKEEQKYNPNCLFTLYIKNLSTGKYIYKNEWKDEYSSNESKKIYKFGKDMERIHKSFEEKIKNKNKFSKDIKKLLNSY